MTDNIQNGEGVEVIQSDREAAAALVPLCFGASELWQSNVRAGYYDDGEIVQAFAKHRHSLAREPATADVDWDDLFDAIRQAWFDGRAWRGREYDSEAIERKWTSQVNALIPSSEPAIAEGERIEKAARYVLDNSRRGNASLNADQYDADTQKLMSAYRDIIGKAIASGFLAQSSTPPASKGVEIPAGWKLVPMEPTALMRAAGYDAEIDGVTLLAIGEETAVWSAMLAASPTPSNDTLQGRGEVEEVLSAILDATTVGKRGSCVTRSKWGSYPSALYHRGRAALQKDTRHDG